VKVFYLGDGYYEGIVKNVNATRDCIIHWDDGSTSSATLKLEDKTDDPANEDRWNVVNEVVGEDNATRTQTAATPTPNANAQQLSKPATTRPRPRVHQQDDDYNDEGDGGDDDDISGEEEDDE